MILAQAPNLVPAEKLILKVLALLRTKAHTSTSPPGSRQLSVMRTLVALPPILKWMEQRMSERRRFTQTTALEERLAKASNALTQAST